MSVEYCLVHSNVVAQFIGFFGAMTTLLQCLMNQATTPGEQCLMNQATTPGEQCLMNQATTPGEC
jgi:hypothetical protein